MAPTIDTLSDLYSDTKTCARLVGLNYVESEDGGLRRVKRGKRFSYQDDSRVTIKDRKLRKRISDLVIPPAWQEVWICPSDSGHVLATGIDEKGRKQYIYHPKWRTVRDLIKFYRMIIFADALPKIRKTVKQQLDTDGLSREKVMACMLWILDNAYIRIGNDIYLQENDSVGLTTLTDKNIVIAGSVVTFSFKGKSGKNQQITFDNKQIARILDELRQMKGARLFRFEDNEHKNHTIDADMINEYLREISGAEISAKDFRTWGGTLMAYMHLREEHLSKADSKKTDAVRLEAVDQAAAVLGNTRTVARSSYVHPHILNTYGSRHFTTYLKEARKQHKNSGLDTQESELVYFLEKLFEVEFNDIKQST